ncbi:MAG TPA: hypothetical protein VGP18_04190 [Solirubrobacteraceae bacterium]|jgi:hypothetical protein|nr:hypothetical protein [Solirubrobacteraceae bacterium]
MTLAIALACLILALVAWDRFLRFRTPRQDDSQTPAGRARIRRVDSPPRFKGNGTVPTFAQGAPRRPRSPRRVAPAAEARRFQGTRRRDQNAIGVACGRPISECTRGEECLCLD